MTFAQLSALIDVEVEAHTPPDKRKPEAGTPDDLLELAAMAQR